MKRSLAIIGIIGLIVCLSVMFMTGCAKKSVVKDQADSAEEKAAAEAAMEKTEEPAQEKASKPDEKADAEKVTAKD